MTPADHFIYYNTDAELKVYYFNSLVFYKK